MEKLSGVAVDAGGERAPRYDVAAIECGSFPKAMALSTLVQIPARPAAEDAVSAIPTPEQSPSPPKYAWEKGEVAVFPPSAKDAEFDARAFMSSSKLPARSPWNISEAFEQPDEPVRGPVATGEGCLYISEGSVRKGATNGVEDRAWSSTTTGVTLAVDTLEL